MSVLPTIVRWLARLSGVLVAGFYVFFALGELTSRQTAGAPGFKDGIGIALITATCLAMLVAMRWELPGAVVSLASLVAFVILVRMRGYAVVAVLATPGFLYLVDWWLHRRHAIKTSGGWAAS